MDGFFIIVALVVGSIGGDYAAKNPKVVTESDFAKCFSHKLGDCNGSEGAGE